MKKVYLSLLLASTSIVATAQVTQRQYSFGLQKPSAVASQKPQVNNTEKAVGVTVWSDDFSVPSDWTIGAANVQGQWQIVSTTPTQLNTYMGAMNSTTKANGFGAFNGVQFLIAGSVDPQDATLTYNTALDLSSYPVVSLSFEQRYRAFNSDETWVEFSTDGGTNWAGVRVNEDVVTNDPSIQTTETINITSLVGGAASVMVRFRWISASGDDGFGSGYGWMVDDVKIESGADNDIQITSSYWGTEGLHYYQIPTTQVAPIDFSSNVTNNGVNDQTNVTLNVDINSGATTLSSTPVTVVSQSSDSLFTTAQFTPAATVGTYNITWGVSQTETDDIPANNSNANITFDVTDYIYARDKGTADNSQDNGGYGFEVGNLFDIWQTQTLYSIDVQLDAATEVGSVIYAKVYSTDDNATTLADYLISEGLSNYHDVVAGDLTGMVHLPLTAPMTLNAGATYFISVATDGTGGNSADVAVATSGKSDGDSYFFNVDDNSNPINTWFSQPNTPMVRMNFLNDVGLTENTDAFGVNLVPNPSADNATVKYILNNTSDVMIVVTDMAGKVMETITNVGQTEGTHSAALNASAYAPGMYNVSVSTNNAVVTKKFVKK